MINPGLEKREMNVKTEERERKRFPFSKQEDKQLLRLVNQYGDETRCAWKYIAMNMKGRNTRQCRERYNLYLRKGVNKSTKWTDEEDEVLLSKYEEIGPHWKMMEEFFEGRNSYNIKNRFISLTRRRRRTNLKNPKKEDMRIAEAENIHNSRYLEDKTEEFKEEQFFDENGNINIESFDENYFCF
ncbi:hypothetical protein M9Y10_032606 [Tritrichomonas musculus]|uniref:Myb-like DNA-binding domain containing protein n=1 Tax=Tritrichomonas musculus TaxID=1915356 RepID=A0ABR2GYX1_9EUKA